MLISSDVQLQWRSRWYSHPTQVHNLRLSKLLPQEESYRPAKIGNKLKPIECQRALLGLNSTLFPHKVRCIPHDSVKHRPRLSKQGSWRRP